MTKNMRWGNEFVDSRDWKIENEKYVLRGEFLLDLDWIKSWDSELVLMNTNKRGAPFEFPESLIKFQAVLSQWINFRGLEGMTRKLWEYTNLPKFNDFSTINRRVNKIQSIFELQKNSNIYHLIHLCINKNNFI